MGMGTVGQKGGGAQQTVKTNYLPVKVSVNSLMLEAVYVCYHIRTWYNCKEIKYIWLWNPSYKYYLHLFVSYSAQYVKKNDARTMRGNKWQKCIINEGRYSAKMYEQ